MAKRRKLMQIEYDNLFLSDIISSISIVVLLFYIWTFNRFLNPHEGYFGQWGQYLECEESFVTSVELELYPETGAYDDLAATNLRMTCSNGKQLEDTRILKDNVENTR